MKPQTRWCCNRTHSDKPESRARCSRNQLQPVPRPRPAGDWVLERALDWGGGWGSSVSPESRPGSLTLPGLRRRPGPGGLPDLPTCLGALLVALVQTLRTGTPAPPGSPMAAAWLGALPPGHCGRRLRLHHGHLWGRIPETWGPAPGVGPHLRSPLWFRNTENNTA